MAKRKTLEVEDAKFLIRIPVDVKDWIEQSAARSYATRNSEIVRALRAQMEAQQQA